MKFKITTIPPEGRNEYGNYYSSDRIAKNVMRVTYNGNASTGGNQKKDPVVEPQDNVILFLGKTTLKYNGQDVAVSAQTQSIDVMGYINSLASDTFVGDLTNSAATNYGIVGMPESGMSITVTDNGTPNTKINIAIDENISVKNGSLIIPCSVNKKPETEPIGSEWEDWYVNGKNNMTLMLECQWEVSAVYENSYVLELSNELAAINCDSEGNILAGAERPTCQAELYLGQGKVTEATYGFTTPVDKNATGISIDTSTGILTFGSNFKFDGTTLEVKITASANGTTVFKIMTITKQYPGADGTPATTRWVVPSHNSITYNPNNGTISPSSITCKCMKQVGEDSPVEDTGTTIYYGYDTANPLTKYTAAVTPDVSKSYLVFGIKNTDGEIYEIETIQIIKEGKDGTDGSNGESAYRLDLSNDNASINCDADGNILATAVRPKCTATLYYGSDKATGVTYDMSFSVSTEGVTINPSTGEITFGSNFNFGITTTSTLEITVTAKINGVLYGSAIMTISRNYAGRNGTDGQDGEDGQDGADAVTYWLEFSSTSFQVDKNDVVLPSTFSIQVMKQIGGETPVDVTPTVTDGTIQVKYGHNTLVPSTQYKNGQTITVDGSKNYITVQLYVNSKKIETETLLILKDGKNGQDGGTGPQGRQGAAVRGPVDWRDQTASRRWCNGTLTNASYPEDGEFIDIVVFDGVYYKCKTSYNGKGGTTAPSSTYWTATDKQYEFVSTNLLLADNAKIKFATNNELYLTDNNGNVTAGAAGGNGISFWAGANEPANGKFKVNYDGSMEASKGKFGVFSIGNLADLESSKLVSDVIYYGQDGEDVFINTEIAPHYYGVKAVEKDDSTKSVSIQIAPNTNEHLGLPNGDNARGFIDVSLGYGITKIPSENYDIAFSTNGKVEAENFFREKDGVKEYVPFMPLADFRITFITDTNYFTIVNDAWYWKGNPIGLDAVTYKYIKVINGEWTAVYTTSSTSGYGLGIYSSAHSKENNRLYIVI